MPLAGQTSAIESAVTQLEREAAELEQDARSCERQAAAAHATADQRERDVADIVRTLLPHAWLWKGEVNSQRLNLDALSDLSYARTRKWQRELDEVHVRALVMWARIATERDESEGAQIFQFIRERFLPDDVDVLVEQRALFPSEKTHADSLRSVVEGWIEKEHAWWSLQWMSEGGLFGLNDHARILRRVADTDQTLPDSLCVWLGSELEELALPNHASTCYARVASSELADAAVLFDLAAHLRDRGDLDQALAVLQSAKRVDAAQPQRSLSIGAHSREAARVLWKLQRYREATRELAAIPEIADLGAAWREELICELIESDEINDAEGYRILKNWLGQVLTAHRDDGAIRRDAAAALLRLTLQRYHPLLRRAQQPRLAAELADAMTPSVSPIILEADESFFPFGAETMEVRRMLDPENGDAIEMRRRVETRTGVAIPPIRILSTAGLGLGRYNILLEGVPLATGTLGSEPLFCTDVDACRRHGIDGRPGRDPLAGSPGLWIDGPIPSSLTTWDHYHYMFRHLEAVVLRNVDRFLTVQQGEKALRAASERLAADEAPHTRLVEALQTLAREGVPLTDAVPVIVHLTRDYGLDSPLKTLVDAARERLRAHIPGADGSRPLVAVRPEIEDAIAQWANDDNGKGVLTLPVMTIEALRREISDQLALEPADSALVVRAHGLRSFVRRISEIDHPSVPVIAYTELPEDLRFLIYEPTAPSSA
jgi:hypothetical protein